MTSNQSRSQRVRRLLDEASVDHRAIKTDRQGTHVLVNPQHIGLAVSWLEGVIENGTVTWVDSHKVLIVWHDE